MGACITNDSAETTKDDKKDALLQSDGIQEAKEENMTSENLCYLDFPRIHFTGKFYFDPPTVNNITHNYRYSMFFDTFERWSEKWGNTPLFQWNAYGDGSFSFADCNIGMAYDKDGNIDENMIGLKINPNLNKITGRMVDNDPDQQLVTSVLYGFGVQIGKNEKNVLLNSEYHPSPVQYLWTKSVAEAPKGYRGSVCMGGSYCSILENCEFFPGDFDDNNSDDNKEQNSNNYKALKDMQEYAKYNNNKLQIKFEVELFDSNAETKAFGYGRIYGVIGCYTLGNPMQSILNGRYLNNQIPAANNGPGQYVTILPKPDSNVIHIDLINALPTTEINQNSPFLEIGNITLMCNNQIIGQPINDSSDGYLKNGCVYTLKNIKSEIFKMIIDKPIHVTYECLEKDNKYPKLLSSKSRENSNGYFASSDHVIMRLGTDYINKYSLTEENAIVYVTKYGKPVNTINNENKPVINLNIEISTLENANDPYMDGPKGHIFKQYGITPPSDWHNYPKYGNWPVTLDIESLNNLPITNGQCIINIGAPKTLKNSEGKLPRQWFCLDSLTYDVTFNIKFENDEKKEETEEQYPYMLAEVIIYDESFDLPLLPSWIDERRAKYIINHMGDMDDITDAIMKYPDVLTTFRQYQNLYPIMLRILKLGNYESVSANISGLIRSFYAPFNSPRYMPVRRDLSGKKIEMIKRFLSNPIYTNIFIDPMEHESINNILELKNKLMEAIKLEFSTIPLYLSAMYSIDPVKVNNKAIRDLFHSIVIQEMVHMSLACNLLLSIGGKPYIAYQDCIPQYTNPNYRLPGGVHPDLFPVELNPLTKEVLQNIFMTVESPAITIDWDHKKNILPWQTFLAQFPKNENEIITNEIETEMKTDTDQKTNIKVDDIQKYVLKNDEIFNPKKLSVWVEPKHKHNIKDAIESKDENILKKVMPKIMDRNVAFNVFTTKLSDKLATTINFKTHSNTIGAFYNVIERGFRDMHRKYGDKLFVVNEETCVKQQIGNSDMNGVNYVYDIKTALQAINTIVREGEGSSMTQIWDKNDQLSHYHKFLEILVGHPIIGVVKDQSKVPNIVPFHYVFSSTEIPFDTTEINSDPKAWNWLKSDCKEDYSNDIRVIRFNQSYGRLLVTLQRVFGEGKKNELQKAIGLMRQLQIDFTQCLWPVPRQIEKDTITENFLPAIAPNWLPPENIIPQQAPKQTAPNIN